MMLDEWAWDDVILDDGPWNDGPWDKGVWDEVTLVEEVWNEVMG